MKKIKLGFAPTRRSIFSAPDALKYRHMTADRLRALGIEFVDIDDINQEGLLYDDNDVKKLLQNSKKKKLMDFFCHIVILAQNMSVPDLRRS